MKAVQFGRKCNEEGEKRQKLGEPRKKCGRITRESNEIKFELRYCSNLTVMCPLQVLPLVRANEARQIQIGAGHCEFIAILAENSDFRVCSNEKKKKIRN